MTYITSKVQFHISSMDLQVWFKLRKKTKPQPNKTTTQTCPEHGPGRCWVERKTLRREGPVSASRLRGLKDFSHLLLRSLVTVHHLSVLPGQVMRTGGVTAAARWLLLLQLLLVTKCCCPPVSVPNLKHNGAFFWVCHTLSHRSSRGLSIYSTCDKG